RPSAPPSTGRRTTVRPLSADSPPQRQSGCLLNRSLRISVRDRTVFRYASEQFWTRQGNSGSGQEAVVDLPGDLITLTGGVLEALPIDDGDPAPAELDKTGLLQDSGGHRHGRSPDPQHVGQELVGHRELVGAYAVLREQEPAGAALLDGVEPVAGNLLRDLDEERLRVPLDQRRQRSLLPDLVPEGFGVHADDRARDLDGGVLLRVHRRRAPGDRHAQQAFVADGRDLDAGAVVHAGENGHNGVDGEVHLVESVSRFREYVLLLPVAGPQLALQALVIRLRERAQQAVGS